MSVAGFFRGFAVFSFGYVTYRCAICRWSNVRTEFYLLLSRRRRSEKTMFTKPGELRRTGAGGAGEGKSLWNSFWEFVFGNNTGLRMTTFSCHPQHLSLLWDVMQVFSETYYNDTITPHTPQQISRKYLPKLHRRCVVISKTRRKVFRPCDTHVSVTFFVEVVKLWPFLCENSAAAFGLMNI